jgi:hypothetical protein
MCLVSCAVAAVDWLVVIVVIVDAGGRREEEREGKDQLINI